MSEPIIHTEHLSRSFGAVKAVDDLSLEVPAGIVFGFLGPNGAGKTTTNYYKRRRCDFLYSFVVRFLNIPVEM